MNTMLVITIVLTTMNIMIFGLTLYNMHLNMKLMQEDMDEHMYGQTNKKR